MTRRLFTRRRRSLWDWLGTDQAVAATVLAVGVFCIVLLTLEWLGYIRQFDAAQKVRQDSHTAAGTVDCRSNK